MEYNENYDELIFSEQDYAWIRSGLIFSFLENVDRFAMIQFFFLHSKFRSKAGYI